MDPDDLVKNVCEACLKEITRAERRCAALEAFYKDGFNTSSTMITRTHCSQQLRRFRVYRKRFKYLARDLTEFVNTGKTLTEREDSNMDSDASEFATDSDSSDSEEEGEEGKRKRGE